MLLGVISDVHGNHRALEAVLDALRDDIDAVVCCGDLIGYGPSPGACTGTVREAADVVVQGNHDRYVREPRNFGLPVLDSLPRYSHLTLSETNRRWLAALPETDTIGGYLVVHNWIRYRETVSTSESPHAEFNGVIMGHTHRQEDFREDGTHFVNPGPVGEPRPSKVVLAPTEIGLKPKYAVVDTEDNTAALHRTEYDLLG